MARYLWHTTAETGHRHRAYRREFGHLRLYRLFVQDAIEADEWVQLEGYEDWYIMRTKTKKATC